MKKKTTKTVNRPQERHTTMPTAVGASNNGIINFFIRCISNNLFIGAFVFFIGFRVWLATGYPHTYILGPLDDFYFAKAANALINGQWMGSYDAITLIKNPFYPMFLAASFFTSLPLFLNETLFCLFACWVMFISIRPLINNRWWRLLIFVLMAYFPASLATVWNLRIYREFVYYSLTLLVVAFSVGLFLRIQSNLKTVVLWAVCLGMAMGAFMLTREEGVWIYPALFFLFGACLWLIWKKGMPQKWWRFSILSLAVVVWHLPILAVSYLNYTYYDFWGISEQLDSDFNRIINTLGRIKTNTWYPYVRASHEALNKAYQASPMMADLQKHLDPLISAWEPTSEGVLANKPAWYLQKYANHGTEMGSGHFLWVLRAAFDQAGYFSNGKFPHRYLKSLAEELENACNNGKLDCADSLNIPFVGSIDKNHIPVIGKMFLSDLSLFFKVDMVKLAPLNLAEWQQYAPQYSMYRKYFEYFDYLTYDPSYGPDPGSTSDDIRIKMLSIKNGISDSILGLFKKITLGLSILGLLGFIRLIWISIWKKTIQYRDVLILLIFFAGLLFSRFSTLVIVDATSTAYGIAYVPSCYLFLYLFVVLSIITCVENSRNKLPLDQESCQANASSSF